MRIYHKILQNSRENINNICVHLFICSRERVREIPMSLSKRVKLLFRLHYDSASIARGLAR